MQQHFQSRPQDVEKFLKKMKEIICREDFDLNKHFILKKRKNDLSDNIYTNINTLQLLNYNTEDIIRELKNLSVNDYYETIIDTIGNECLLYAFIKKIKEEKIYIKLTIRNNKIIFCISFHVSKELII